MTINLFLLLIKSNIYSPLDNSLNYVNNNLNISWQNNFTENNIHIFLLQDEIIVKYPNNSNILSNEITNDGYYNWVPPYDLNRLCNKLLNKIRTPANLYSFFFKPNSVCNSELILFIRSFLLKSFNESLIRTFILASSFSTEM